MVWIYGRRFVQLDTFKVDEDEDVLPLSGPSLDDYPIAAYINYYQMSIIVVKKQEVRTYDIERGQFQQLQN
jgi:hypothetical protein